MEGCSKYCSFLRRAVHARRGSSRPLEDVLAEVRHLASQGVREVTLLART